MLSNIWKRNHGADKNPPWRQRARLLHYWSTASVSHPASLKINKCFSILLPLDQLSAFSCWWLERHVGTSPAFQHHFCGSGFAMQHSLKAHRTAPAAFRLRLHVQMKETQLQCIAAHNHYMTSKSISHGIGTQTHRRTWRGKGQRIKRSRKAEVYKIYLPLSKI